VAALDGDPARGGSVAARPDDALVERGQLQVLMEHMPDTIYFKDVEGRYSRINRALAELYGLDDPAQAVGRSDFDFYPEEDARSYRRDEEEVMRTGKPLRDRIERCVLQGRRARWFSTTKVPLYDAAGRVIGIAGISREVTAFKKATDRLERTNARVDAAIRQRTEALSEANRRLEQEIAQRRGAQEALLASETRFRELAEHIQEVFWLTDWRVRRVIYVSPAYETIFGSTAERLYTDPLDWLAAIHPKDRERVHESFRTKTEQGLYDEEYRLVRPDGSIRWIRDRGFVIRDETGEVVRVAGLAQDITERVLASEAARITREELCHVTQIASTGIVAASLAHNLRQPLQAIANYGETGMRALAVEPLDVAAAIADLRAILGQARRAADLLQELCRAARLAEPQLTESSMNEIVMQVGAHVQPAADAAGVNVQLDLQEDLPPIRVDPAWMQQILINLAVNGIEAMTDPAVVRRVLTIVTRGAHDGRIELIVRDTGAGLDPQVAPRAFEPFVTTKRSGMGLGLSIARRLVDALGGELELDRSASVGAAFRMLLPARA
jgi:PAS domain S-box-containing protein